MCLLGMTSGDLDAARVRQYARVLSDREGQSEELPPEVQDAWDRFVVHVHALQRRRARRGFLAFLVIVVYGGIVANFAQTHDVEQAKHATLMVWFWPVLLGIVAYVLVAVLLRDDE
jgi:hypothetical protein